MKDSSSVEDDDFFTRWRKFSPMKLITDGFFTDKVANFKSE